jgi:SAM-dependent methyltransferase
MDKTNSVIETGRIFYETMDAGKEGYWKHMPGPRHRIANIINFMHTISPQSIGDFGCGNGALLKEIHKYFTDAHLTGIDISQAQITENQKQFPNMAWACCDLSSPGINLPIKGLVDLAVSSEVLEHTNLHDQYLKNVFSCIRKEGHLFLSTQSGKIYPTERHCGHLKHWQSLEIQKALEVVGFSSIKVWNEGFPFHNLSKSLANLNPERTIKHFGTKEYGFYQRSVCMILKFLFQFNSKCRGSQLYAIAQKL